jgi:hypothetical protein
MLGAVGAATRSARDFCTACGWPLYGPRCDACGEYRSPLALEDSMRRFVPRGHERVDATGLEKATEAWRRGDYPRALSLCLAAETSGTVRAATLPEGPGWAVIGKEASVFVQIDSASAHLLIESPVARLPRKQRVPAMRTALELCDGEELASRLCLREDLLVLRFVAQLGAVSPALVRYVIRDMAGRTERYAEVFVAAFAARPAGNGGGWESLGRKRTLATLTPAPARRSVVPPPPSTLRPSETPPPAMAPLPSFADDLPPILAPALAEGGARASAPDGLPPVLAPTAALADPGRLSDFDSLPPVLAPPPDGVPQTARFGATASTLAAPPPEREAPPETARLGAIPSLTTPMPFSAPVARRRRDTIPGMTGISADAIARASTSEAESSPEGMQPRRPTVRMGTRDAQQPPDSPEAKLCDLLHQAQALATALSFEERPATMMLLVRAAVFRAVLEFGEAVPDAVAYLYRTAAAATRVIFPSAPPAPGKRPTIPIPMAEPALLAMERIVSSRALLPKERPFAVEPLATAAQAREHLARYVEEIEASPADPALRHFLAVGALSELLARAKLPAQTSQRLKDIVQHARTEGAKPATIELMMTALKRIVAG